MDNKRLSLFIIACLLGSSSNMSTDEGGSKITNLTAPKEASKLMKDFPPPLNETVTKSNWMIDPYIRWSLTHMRELIQTKRIWRGAKKPSTLPYNVKKNIGTLLVSDEKGNSTSLESLLNQTNTDAFLVMYNGKIAYETYWNGMRPQDIHWTASLTKVFTGLLVSSLAQEGRISMSANAATYIPELAGTPFGNATVQQLMDMQVSATYPTHGYDDSVLGNQDTMLFLASDLLPRGNHFDGPMTIYDMLKEAQQEKPLGSGFSYNNGSAETLGWIIRRVTGQSLEKVMEDRIWSKLAPEEDAEYISDPIGTEEASAGLSATLRDMARFGEMVLENGTYNGKRIFPETIFNELKTDGNKQNSTPSNEQVPKSTYTYHNLWWFSNNSNKTFEVTGSFGQRLYIDPQTKMVIVHFSSNANSSSNTEEAFSNAYLKIAQFLKEQKK